MAFDIGSILSDALTGGIAKIVSLFKVDPTLAMTKQAEITELTLNIQAQLENKLQDAITAQIEVNKQEAASPSVFVAGWRPAIGWICGCGLFMQFIVNPIATWIAALMKHPIVFPTLDLGSLMTLLLGMLGLGTMRTYEKVAGVPGSDKLK